ncbi:hypothetical protein Dimus_036774, partial [Dionaea muscipula]
MCYMGTPVVLYVDSGLVMFGFCILFLWGFLGLGFGHWDGEFAFFVETDFCMQGISSWGSVSCLVVLRCSWLSSSWDSPSFIHGWGFALFAPCWQGVLALRVTSGRLRYVDVVHQKWLSWLSFVCYMVDDCGAFCPRAYGLDPSGFCQAFFLASMVSLAADFAIDRI